MRELVPISENVDLNQTKVAASGVLTWANGGVNVTNNKKVTIGTTEYVFKTALTGAANEVLIGADGDASLQNLVNLIKSGREAVAASGVLTSNQTKPTAGKVVVIGAKTYTFVAALTEVKATATLTASGQPTAGQKVTIGTNVYTFVTSLTSINKQNRTTIHAAPYSVLIGADYDTTLGNLVAAINGAAGEGTKYAYSTPAHTLVDAGAVGSHASIMTAKTVGVAGNSIAKAEDSANLDWDGTGDTFSGGLDSVANEVSLVGADAGVVIQNLIAAVNGAAGAGTKYSSATAASTEMTAVLTSQFVMTVTAKVAGAAGNALAKTEDADELDWDGAGAVMTGGVTATLAHATVGAADVANHATTVTAKTAGFAGNSIAKSTDETTLDWDGTGAFLTGGGGTIGTYIISKGGGVARRFIATIPQMTGSPTFAISLYDVNNVLLKALAATAAENAISDTAYEVMLSPGDYVKITATTPVEDDGTLPINLQIR